VSIFGRDPSIIKLAGNLMPGMVQSIEGADRKFLWKKQKGTGSSGASIIFEGADIADAIKVVVFAPTLAMQEACKSWRRFIAPVKIGGKPPTFAVENPIFEFNEIGRISIAEIAQPKVSKDRNVVFQWTFVEYQPPAPAKTGPANAATKAKAGTPGAAGGDKEVADLQAQAAAAKAELAKAMAKS
jgi:hypothetical protein